MSGPTLNQLVRDHIRADMLQIEGASNREVYIDRYIDMMPNIELLERISNALDALVPELSVRLGI
jgi:hypothetical protein